MAAALDESIFPKNTPPPPAKTIETERPLLESLVTSKRAAPRPAFVIINGPDTGTLMPFPEDQTSVIAGRSEDVTFRFDDPSVSRQHARFRVERKGLLVRVFVEDLESTNGTQVGRRPVVGELELFDGDRVFVGDVLVRLRFMDPDDIRVHSGLRREVEAAKRDALTGLYTRRYISERLPNLVAAHRRNRVPISVAMLDLDKFKSINDTYGHVQGDGVLYAAAEAVRACIRGADIAVRYGGEEFAVILPGAAQETAERVGTRIRRAISKLTFPATTPPLQVTVSVGVATLHRLEEIEEWFSRADEALYAAKRGGRDQVCLAGPHKPMT